MGMNIQYGPAHAVLFIEGALDQGGDLHAIVPMMEQLRAYFQYRRLEVELVETSGGRHLAPRIVEQMARWIRDGAEVRVTAYGEVSGLGAALWHAHPEVSRVCAYGARVCGPAADRRIGFRSGSSPRLAGGGR